MKIIEISKAKNTHKEKYENIYGHHFNEKLYHFAVANMIDRNGNSISPLTKSELEGIMNRYGFSVNSEDYDACYIFSMAYADFLTSSLQDEYQLCLYVRDYLNDVDGYDTIAFCRYMADCKAKNLYINWEDMI